MKQLSETQRYQVYATPADFIANPIQPLIEGKTLIDYEPVNPVAPVSDSDADDQNSGDTDSSAEPEPIPTSALNAIVTDSIPTFLLVAQNDEMCTKEQADWIEAEITTENVIKQNRVYLNAGHDFFTWSNQMSFVSNLKSNLGNSASGATAMLLQSFMTIMTVSTTILLLQ